MEPNKSEKNSRHISQIINFLIVNNKGKYSFFFTSMRLSEVMAIMHPGHFYKFSISALSESAV